MKFYLATIDGRRQIESTQADAKALDKNFERLDIPTDHDGLKAFVQDLYAQIDSGGAQPAGTEVVTPDMAPDPAPELAPKPPSPVTAAKSDLDFRQEVERRWPSQPLAWRFDMMHETLEEARVTIKWQSKPADQATG